MTAVREFGVWLYPLQLVSKATCSANKTCTHCTVTIRTIECTNIPIESNYILNKSKERKIQETRIV